MPIGEEEWDGILAGKAETRSDKPVLCLAKMQCVEIKTKAVYSQERKGHK